MDDQRDAGRADTTLRRPAVDPAAGEHGVAELEEPSRRARAVRRAFGGPPAGQPSPATEAKTGS